MDILPTIELPTNEGFLFSIIPEELSILYKDLTVDYTFHFHHKYFPDSELKLTSINSESLDMRQKNISWNERKFNEKAISKSQLLGCDVKSKPLRVSKQRINAKTGKVTADELYKIKYFHRNKTYKVTTIAGNEICTLNHDTINSIQYRTRVDKEKAVFISILRNINMNYTSDLDLNQYSEIHNIFVPELYQKNGEVNDQVGRIKYYNHNFVSNYLQFSAIGDNFNITYFTDPKSFKVLGIQLVYSNRPLDFIDIITAFVVDK